MKVIKKLMIGFIVICISLIILDFFYEGNDGWKLDSWKEFREEINRDYDLIKKIEIYGTSPTLFVSFTIDNKMDLKEIDSVFDKTKSFLLNEKVFEELRKYHNKRNGGNMIEVHIIFKYITANEPRYYDFYSISEEDGSFQTWYIEYDDVKKEYNIQDI